MRNLLAFLCMALASLGLLTACVTTSPSGGPPAGAVRSGGTGAYTNVPSGFRFPLYIDSFERSEVSQYDKQGQDVGVGYNDLISSVALTVFVYPMAQQPPDNTLEGHFAGCKSEVLARHRNAKLLSEGPVRISPGGVQHSGQRAVFAATEVFGHQEQALRSELCLFTNGSRFILYRATYPASREATAEKAARGFLNTLSWPPER